MCGTLYFTFPCRCTEEIYSSSSLKIQNRMGTTSSPPLPLLLSSSLPFHLLFHNQRSATRAQTLGQFSLSLSHSFSLRVVLTLIFVTRHAILSVWTIPPLFTVHSRHMAHFAHNLQYDLKEKNLWSSSLYLCDGCINSSGGYVVLSTWTFSMV